MFKLSTALFVCLAFSACSNAPDGAGGRAAMDDLARVTPEQWKLLSQRTIYFGHQSVGADIVEGLREIAAETPQVGLTIAGEGLENAPGVLNEFRIGRNEDPESKNAAFVSALQGTLGPRPVLMFKYCYVDVDENTDARRLFERYQQTVAALRDKHPEATVVHVTLPLQAEPSFVRYWMNTVRGIPTTRDANATRKKYNDMLRAAYGGREPVFDLAAVESSRADGSVAHGTAGAQAIPALADEWTTDGGHLNAAGRRRAAARLLATLATLPDSRGGVAIALNRP